MSDELTLELKPKDGNYAWSQSQVNMVLKCIQWYFNSDNGFVRVGPRLLSYHELGDKIGEDHFDDFAERCRHVKIAGKIAYTKTPYPYERYDEIKYFHSFHMEYFDGSGMATDTVTLVDHVSRNTERKSIRVDTVTIDSMFLRTVCYTVYETLFPEDCVFECSHPEVVKDLKAEVKAFVMETKPTLEEEREKELEMERLKRKLALIEAESSQAALKAKRRRLSYNR